MITAVSAGGKAHSIFQFEKVVEFCTWHMLANGLQFVQEGKSNCNPPPPVRSDVIIYQCLKAGKEPCSLPSNSVVAFVVL